MNIFGFTKHVLSQQCVKCISPCSKSAQTAIPYEMCGY